MEKNYCKLLENPTTNS